MIQRFLFILMLIRVFWIIACYNLIHKIKHMSKKIIGILIAIFGTLIIFSSNENAWIFSAVLLGAGSGVFFWKD